MLLEHPKLKLPEAPPGFVWRYMRLSRFEEMLKSKVLFLPNATRFQDPFDCMPPGDSFNQHVREHSAARKIAFFTDPEYLALSPMEQQRKERAFYQGSGLAQSNRQKQLVAQYRATRRELFVSCWHANEGQSAALWSVYSYQKSELLTNVNSGSDPSTELFQKVPVIAVRVVLDKFVDWLKKDDLRFYFGQVIYGPTPAAVDKPDPIQVAIYKRQSFDHEKELRVIHHDPDGKYDHNTHILKRPFDLAAVQAEVFVDPLVPHGIVNKVQESVRAVYKDNAVPVRKSDLYDGSMY